MNLAQEFGIAFSNWPLFLSGAAITLYFSAIGMVGGLVLGVLGAYARRARFKPISVLAALYVGMFRNTPLLIQLYLYYFGISSFGVPMNPWTAGFIGIIINNGAYLTEIIRGGMNGVPKTEIEAGHSLGLSGLQVASYITIPRIIRIVFPSLSNQLILIVISSALLGLIGVPDLFLQITSLQSRTFASFGILITGALIYIAITLLLTGLFALAARKLLNIKTKGAWG